MAKYDVCEGGGVEKIRQMQTRGGGGKKTRKFCRHHLSMAPKVDSPGLVKLVSALAYHFCLNLPAAFTHPGAST